MARSVLIVDDEFGLAEIAADFLRDLGYEVVIAINGKAGLECLARKQTDVVFVDLMMPVMGGEEMIAEMRSRAELAAIPVVLMTALPEAIKGDSGANAVLVKPFSFKELIATIRDLLHE